MSNTATKIKTLTGWTGSASVYRLDPPMPVTDWDDNKTGEAEHVVVSATVVPFGGGPETYIFESDAEGNVLEWGELDGSFKGGLDHAEALRGAGYEVVS